MPFLIDNIQNKLKDRHLVTKYVVRICRVISRAWHALQFNLWYMSYIKYLEVAAAGAHIPYYLPGLSLVFRLGGLNCCDLRQIHLNLTPLRFLRLLSFWFVQCRSRR